MLTKFTINGGSVPVTQQAREDVLNDRLHTAPIRPRRRANSARSNSSLLRH